MIHVVCPYSLTKNLGASYNEAFTTIGENDWICLHDYDVLFLLPETINHLYGYVERYPDTGLFTCFVNRASPLSKMQLLNQRINEDANIKNHYQLAKNQTKYLYDVTEINTDISGFLMLISKKTWNDFKFIENGQCLGLDTEFGRRLRANGKKILLMNGIYIFHFYRMMNGIFNKKHLV